MILCGEIAYVRGEGSSLPDTIEVLIDPVERGNYVIGVIPHALLAGSDGRFMAFRGEMRPFVSTAIIDPADASESIALFVDAVEPVPA